MAQKNLKNEIQHLQPNAYVRLYRAANAIKQGLSWSISSCFNAVTGKTRLTNAFKSVGKNVPYGIRVDERAKATGIGVGVGFVGSFFAITAIYGADTHEIAVPLLSIFGSMLLTPILTLQAHSMYKCGQIGHKQIEDQQRTSDKFLTNRAP